MKYILSSLLALCIFSTASPAQWGVQVGAGYDIQRGTFTAPCACQYSDGSGYALRAAVSYDLISILGLTIGLRPGVDYKEFASAHDYAGGATALHDSANITQTYLTIDPYIRYTIPVVGLFVEVAPSLQYLAASHFFQRKYGVYEGSISDSVWENGPLENTSSTRYAARVSAGFNFGFLGLTLAPTVSADIPLQDIRSADKNGQAPTMWGITTLYGSIGVFF